MADNARELLEALSRELKLSPEALQASCERGSAEDLLKNVDSDRAKQVESILNDPQRFVEKRRQRQGKAGGVDFERPAKDKGAARQSAGKGADGAARSAIR